MQWICLHGLGQTAESWQPALAQLGAAGRGACCPDLAGLLRGQKATYQNLYRAVSDLCDSVGEKVGLCGLSLGGVLALNYAADRPERVAALALIAPQYRAPKGLLRLQDLLFRFMPNSAFSQTGFEKGAFIQLCRSMMGLDLSRSLSQVRCPALILCGQRDAANKRAAARLAGSLKRAGFCEVPGAGHELNKDAPEELARLLAGFCCREHLL